MESSTCREASRNELMSKEPNNDRERLSFLVQITVFFSMTREGIDGFRLNSSARVAGSLDVLLLMIVVARYEKSIRKAKKFYETSIVEEMWRNGTKLLFFINLRWQAYLTRNLYTKIFNARNRN